MEVLAISMIVMILVVISWISPSVQSRGASPAARCHHRLLEIGLALKNYHDVYGELPPAYTVDVDGTPLHSWRTLLLPYLDRAHLYRQIDLSKPWNAPENANVFENHAWLQCPSANLSKHETTYLAIVTEESCLRPGQSLSFSDITDGMSKTIGVIEARQDQAVPWMEPRNLDEAGLVAAGSDTQKMHFDSRNILLMDGDAEFLSQTTPLETIKALATAAGGETIGEY